MVQCSGRAHFTHYLVVAIVGYAIVFASQACADVPRVLPQGKLPNDRRLGPQKDLNGYFPFTPAATPEQWAARASRIKRQLLVALGLWPMPTKTPANAVIHGRIERDGYTVEKVYLESFPGHFVTGNLYRPQGKKGKVPGVLCPHGHWPDGRFMDAGVQKVRQQIMEGAERFEVGGRHPLQARCMQLARMGCVVFHYDMIGYADSVQIPAEIAHRFAKQRPHMDKPEAWGFFGVQAELRQQSIMGLQTYNSIRALDWLLTLEDVDPARIAVTGASGGGTQSFILGALDPRVSVAFPAVMVSTAMQGGCTCENASHLRVGTGNVEICAMIAPRALGMTGADDWTKELMIKGYPELRQHYAMLRTPDMVMAKVLAQFPHNYNYVSREVMYQWMNKQLKLNLPEPVLEEDYRPLTTAEMSVWDAKHPKPAGGEAYERSLCKIINADSERQLAALTPRDAASLTKFKETVGGAVDILVGRSLPKSSSLQAARRTSEDRSGYQQILFLLRNTPENEELPAILLRPKNYSGRLVLWIDGRGKAGLFTTSGELRAEVRRLLDGGMAVASADLLYQGEFLPDGKPLQMYHIVDNIREFVGFTLGYNTSVFAGRVQDVLSLAAFFRTDEGGKKNEVLLLGFNGGGRWAAAALAQAPSAFDGAAIDTGSFRFVQIKSYRDPDLWPGITKYGDLPGLLALGAPTPLWLAGEGPQAPALVTAAYQAAGQPTRLQVYTGPDEGKLQAATEWLAGRKDSARSAGN